MFLSTVLIAGCICFLGARTIPLPWETSHPEAAVGYNALRLVNTGKIYPSVEEPPYTPVAYMPLYYVVLGVGAKAGSLGMDGVLRFGRSLSLLSFLLIAVLVYRWSRLAGAAVLFAWMGAAFALSQLDAFPWNATARPDLLAVVLSVTGLYMVVRAQNDRAVIVSGVLLSLALLTKQSAVAAPLAAGVWLLIQKRFRTAAILAVATAVPVLACLGILQARGEHLFSNLGYLTHAGRNTDGQRELLLLEFGTFNPRLVVLGLAIVGAISALSKRAAAPGLAAIYFVISWYIVLATISHVGSNNYYFIEPWTASALMAVFGLCQLREWATGTAKWAVVAVLALSMFPLASGAREAFGLIRQDGLVHNGGLAGAMRGASVLTDVPYLAAQSRTPEMLDSYFISILEQNQVWKPVPISSNVHAQAYDLIILSTNYAGMRKYRGYGFLSPSISRELVANYQFFCAVQVRDGPGQLGYHTINVAIPQSRRPGHATITGLAEGGCVEGVKPAQPPGIKSFALILQGSAPVGR